MKIKRLLSILLCMLLCIGLIPAMAFAAEGYKVLVGGIWSSEGNADDVFGDGGSVVYKQETNTITGAQNTSTGISNFGELPIHISGNGKLTIELSIFKGNAIRGNNVTIDGTTLEMYTSGTALSGYPLTIKNGAKVTAILSGEADSVAVAGGEVKISNSTLEAESPTGNSINVDDIKIEDSTVKATSISEKAYPAIYAAKNIDVTDKSNVVATSSGMRGVFIDGNMTVKDSTVTAIGATQEGMVVTGTVDLTNAELKASGKSDDNSPAIVTKNFNITNSEVTAEGGFDLFDWDSGDIDGSSLNIIPADGKLMEFKVDGNNWDGSAAIHFKEGNQSPYDTAISFSTDEINRFSEYRYIHIGEHIHTGGTANCEIPAICEDCGKSYGNIDPDYHHGVVKVDAKAATCTEDGNIEYWHCEACDKYYSDVELAKEITLEETVRKATGHSEIELENVKESTCTAEGYTGDEVCKICGEKVEKGRVTAKTAHNFKEGKCTVCGGG